MGAKPSGAAYISNDMDEVAFMARVMLEEKEEFSSVELATVVPPPALALFDETTPTLEPLYPKLPLMVNVPLWVVEILLPLLRELVLPNTKDAPGLRDILRRKYPLP